MQCMYLPLWAASTIKARRAWTLSEIPKIPKGCTNVAMAMCMSQPQADVPSAIFRSFALGVLSLPPYRAKCWRNGQQQAFQCQIEISGTELSMRVASS